MWKSRWLILLSVSAAVAGYTTGCMPPPEKPRRKIVPVVVPRPMPFPVRPLPCPGPYCPRRPWYGTTALIGATVGGRISPDGVQIECDYPAARMVKNKAGTDGAGLCVFDSASRAMDWHGVKGGYGLLDWMTHKPGGGYPEKFDAMMKEYFTSLSVPIPGYVQMDGTDTSFVRKALDAGKLVCCTYNYSPSGRYSGERISHMVNVHHHDGQRVAIGDNNFCGADQYEWLTVQEWEKCAKDSRGRLWAIAFDAPPPPPPPHN